MEAEAHIIGNRCNILPQQSMVQEWLTLLKTAAMSFSSKVRSKNETSVPEDSNAGRSKADAVQRKRSKVPAGAICRWMGRHKHKHKSH